MPATDAHQEDVGPSDAELNADLRGSLALVQTGAYDAGVRARSEDANRAASMTPAAARAFLEGAREATESYIVMLTRILAPRLEEAGGSLATLAKAGKELVQIDEALKAVGA